LFLLFDNTTGMTHLKKNTEFCKAEQGGAYGNNSSLKD